MEPAAPPAPMSACACACVHRCLCGDACARCFSEIDDEDEANDEASSSAPPSSSSRVLPLHRLAWQEQLFRRQVKAALRARTGNFASLCITRHLSHLSLHIPRARALYLAYFHFRVRGFVLSDGLKLGVDYAAYPPGGAASWHAQFAILVGDIEPAPGSSSSTLTQLPPPPANCTFEHAMRTMHICVKQKKTCLYVRVFSNAAAAFTGGSDLFDDVSSALPPSSAAAVPAAIAASSSSASVSVAAPGVATSAVSTTATAEPASLALAGYSVSVVSLSNWFITKGRSLDNKLQQQQARQQHQQQGKKQPKQQQQQQQGQASKKQKTKHDTQPAAASNAMPMPPAATAAAVPEM